VKLRIARKIIKAVGTPDEARYSRHQIGRAFTRTERTKSARQSHRYFCALMDHLGVEGRANVLVRSGAPGMAFDLLMRQGEPEARP
jgi:hypothetical protein